MAVTGKKLSELTDKVETIQGTERIYVSDGTNVPKYIETSQLAKSTDIPDVSNYVTNEELAGMGYATTTDLGNYVTTSTANSTFATKEELGNIDAILDNINGEVIQ